MWQSRHVGVGQNCWPLVGHFNWPLTGRMYALGKALAELSDPAIKPHSFLYLILIWLWLVVAWPLVLAMYSHDRDLVYWDKWRKLSKKPTENRGEDN